MTKYPYKTGNMDDHSQDMNSRLKSILEHMKHLPKEDRVENDILVFAVAASIKNKKNSNQNDRVSLPLIDISLGLRRSLQILLPIFFICTLIGTLVTAAVMARLSRRKLSVCLYLSLLAIIDLSLVCVRAGDYWLQLTFDMDLLNQFLMLNSAICSSYCMIFNVLFHLRGLFHIAAAMDIYLLYRDPIKSFLTITRERVQHVVLILVTLTLVLNSQFLWTYSIVDINHQQMTIPKGNYCSYNTKWVESSFRTLIWPTVDFVVGDLLPIVGIGVVLILCILTLKVRNVRPRESTSHLARYIIDVHAFKELRRLGLFITCVFWVCILPQSFYYIYKYLIYHEWYTKSPSSASTSSRVIAKASVSLSRSSLESGLLTSKHFLIFDTALRLMFYIFSSATFLLYMIFSTKFRRAVRSCMLCKEPLCWWYFSTDNTLYALQRNVITIQINHKKRKTPPIIDQGSKYHSTQHSDEEFL